MTRTELVDPMASVRAYLGAEKSDNTRRAYKSDWADFTTWCAAVDAIALPAEPILVARYLAQLADSGLRSSTIERRVAAIRSIHKAAALEPPTNSEGVKAVMRGIRRSIGKRQVKKAPATAELIANLRYPDGLAGIRDRAIMLVGFAAALRRSEIVDLKVNDIEFRPKGMIVQLGATKTDQDGNGVKIAIPRGRGLKPVAALEAWLQASGITDGPLFRPVDRHGRLGAQKLSDRSVARIVKRAVRAAGIDESVFSGHSLRAGFVTTSLDHKVDVLAIMKVTRHAKVDTLKGYDRREMLFDELAGEGFL